MAHVHPMKAAPGSGAPSGPPPLPGAASGPPPLMEINEGNQLKLLNAVLESGDTNGDHVVDQEEFAAAVDQEFNMMDLNNDGILDPYELQNTDWKATDGVRKPVSKAEFAATMQAEFDTVDTNQDNVIDEHELAMLELKSMDLNNDGHVSQDEFLASGGTKSEFRQLDTNNDKVLSLNEFAHRRAGRRYSVTRADSFEALTEVQSSVRGVCDWTKPGILAISTIAILGWVVPILDLMKDTDTQQAFWLWLFNTFASLSGVMLAMTTVARSLPSQEMQANRMWWKPSASNLGVASVLSLEHVKKALGGIIITNEKLVEATDGIITRLQAFLGFMTLIYLLDSAHGVLQAVARREADKMNADVAVRKSRDICYGFIQSGNPNKDDAFLMSMKSPAQVLSEVGGFYFLLGKFGGLMLLLLHFAGVGIYENIVFVLVSFVISAGVATLHLHEIIAPLVAMCISRPFYLGEIVSLSRPGMAPANEPQTHLAGFVEAVTWGYVVIREFGRKQVFVPIGKFDDLVVHNWTRRPTKDCFFVLALSPHGNSAEPVAAMARFVRKWIKEHPDVDQKCYQKAVLHSITNGMNLQVIFYPKPKSCVYQLRADFLVMLFNMADRLGLTVVPQDMRIAFPEQRHNFDTAGDARFDDLLPSQSLRARAGYAPPKD